MKKCPNCNQYFGVENDFCLNDGTPLVADTGGQVQFQSSGSMPTEYLRVPQTAAAVQPASSSNILYMVIGILATALVGAGIYLVMSRDAPQPPDAASAAAAEKNETNNPPVQTAAVTIVNTLAAPAAPPVNPNLTPSGNWTGELSYPSGSTFSAQASLTKSDDGQVVGQIVWTLLRTANPKNAGKVGQGATEFVRGTYNAASRTLTINGHTKNDPIGLIILDKYRLIISEDGRNLTGSSYGGKSRGKFGLRRN